MDISEITTAMSVTSSSSNLKSSAAESSELTMSDFFTLMAAQLQNQTMYDTVDNAEFMSQMVQFSTLSQISELTTTINSSLAVSMLGKRVNVATSDNSGTLQNVVGEVTQVSYQDGKPMLRVNGALYELSSVTDVVAEAGSAE